MSMSPPDEASSRRPDFLGGPAITLANGQEWHFPRPTSYFVPDDDAAGVRRHWNLGDDYGALFDRCMEAESDLEMIGGELALARSLLLRNYDLTPAQAGSLLRFGYGATADPDAAAMRLAVMAVATGKDAAPKASSDGSG